VAHCPSLQKAGNPNRLYAKGKQMYRAPLRGPMNLNRLAYFAAVVETGSFTRGAASLGITKAVVSQQVAKLEEEIGATLLVRTTRSVRPTEAGRALHARCAVILREAADGFEELAQGAASPQGTLRVAAPLDYGTCVVVPVATELTRLYPECGVAVTLSDERLALESVDLAIRVGWLADSSLQARRIGVFEQCLVCAPSLAHSVARVREPDGVRDLPFVAHSALTEPLVWRFTNKAREQRTVRMRSSLAIDATPAVYAAVLAGAGLSVLPDYLVGADLASGRLRRVLPEWSLRKGGIHAMFPAARFRPAKVGRFVELMVKWEAERSARWGASAAARPRQ
jgi:DNA-binding transcriptional LysR family regulator